MNVNPEPSGSARNPLQLQTSVLHAFLCWTERRHSLQCFQRPSLVLVLQLTCCVSFDNSVVLSELQLPYSETVRLGARGLETHVPPPTPHTSTIWQQ